MGREKAGGKGTREEVATRAGAVYVGTCGTWPRLDGSQFHKT